LRFALNHANHYPIDRIFYIIPYTSIIDQNAEDIRKIVEDKDENGKYFDRIVLEHHSNLTPDEETYRQRLLAENWDAPIVFTTQVQFFEALFGSGTRSIRRMHQLARSIIIIDEVQTVPINCLHMLNTALRFLVNDCGSTVILCTATQPPLDQIDNKFKALTLSSDNRIISDEKALFNQLKRVDVFDIRKPGGWSDEEISELALQQLQENGSVLVVVNTKKSARSLYDCLAKRYENLYHLSTNMCPAHRMEILTKVKKDLAEKKPVACISTQLIEAGVDIDFGAVIRYIAGLDSIAQSSGRCNRHGTQASLGKVWVVNPKEEKIESLKAIKIGQQIAERVLSEFMGNPASFGNDIIGLEAMARYYNYYFYERKDEMSYKVNVDSAIGRDDDLFNILSVNKISNDEYTRKNSNSPHGLPFTQSFQSAAREFQVIDSATRGVIVQYNEGKEIVTNLCNDNTIEEQSRLLRNAQRYSVNLFNHEFMELNRIGAIIETREGTGVYYLDDQYYSDKYGWSNEIINVRSLLRI
jgi:CRISPR-associated helicase Cas3